MQSVIRLNFHAFEIYHYGFLNKQIFRLINIIHQEHEWSNDLLEEKFYSFCKRKLVGKNVV